MSNPEIKSEKTISTDTTTTNSSVNPDLNVSTPSSTNTELINQTRQELASQSPNVMEDLNPDIARYKTYVESLDYKDNSKKTLRTHLISTLDAKEEFDVSTGKSDDIEYVQKLLAELGLFKGEATGVGSPELVELLKKAKTMVNVGLAVKAEMFGATTALAIEQYLEKQRNPAPTPQPKALSTNDISTPEVTTPPATTNQTVTPSSNTSETTPQKNTPKTPTEEMVLQRSDLSDPFSPLVSLPKSEAEKQLAEYNAKKEKQKKQSEDSSYSDFLNRIGEKAVEV